MNILCECCKKPVEYFSVSSNGIYTCHECTNDKENKSSCAVRGNNEEMLA